MRNILRYFATPQCAMIAVGAMLMALVSLSLIPHADAADGSDPSKGRLVTIHDREQERVILTSASTIKQALDEAHISLDPKDTVEPAVDSKLVANSYYVNIYRARPVIVVDGPVREKIMTPYQTADKIAKDAGVVLHDEDKTTLQPTGDIVSDGAALELRVDRATEFTLDLYGTQTQAYTQTATVGDMLKEKSIALGQNDTLSVPQATPITSGMVVNLWRNGVQTVTEHQTINFSIRQVQDADQPVGYKKIQTPGIAGSKDVTYEINMQNGKEIDRNEIQTLVTKQSEEQVEVVGVKSVLPPGSHQDWMAAAGISPDDYGYVEYIVGHEGGWCPVRWQGDHGCSDHGSVPSVGGYGLVQATPGAKMASAGADWLTNPITQLRWATGYAVGRYGSWSGAYNHWLSRHNW